MKPARGEKEHLAGLHLDRTRLRFQEQREPFRKFRARERRIHLAEVARRLLFVQYLLFFAPVVMAATFVTRGPRFSFC